MPIVGCLHVATTPSGRAVGAEITNNKGLIASAAGTAEHPDTNVASKATLNRLLHSSRFAGVRVAISRAGVKSSKFYVPAAACMVALPAALAHLDPGSARRAVSHLCPNVGACHSAREPTTVHGAAAAV